MVMFFGRVDPSGATLREAHFGPTDVRRGAGYALQYISGAQHANHASQATSNPSSISYFVFAILFVRT